MYSNVAHNAMKYLFFLVIPLLFICIVQNFQLNIYKYQNIKLLKIYEKIVN